MIVNHQLLQNNFLPSWEIKTLVLGTFNPEGGDVVDYFYGRKRNNFWKSLAHASNYHIHYFRNNFERKIKFMRDNYFGCTDIITDITVEDHYAPQVRGKGYSDSKLFNLTNVTRTYNFDNIKGYLIEKKVKKIIYTWGKRNEPNEFNDHINNLIIFCIQENIEFVQPCLSPSPRSGNTIIELSQFYSNHLLG